MSSRSDSLEPIGFSRHQAAKMIGIGLRTLDEWVRRGWVRGNKRGGRRLFTRAELEAAVTVENTSERSRDGESAT